jgi:pimeloyl-ACP methyl ester carboxylesterase
MTDIRKQQMLHVNGVDLCAETFGKPGDPALLLIMGSSAAMDWWEDEFCERLAAGGRFVIRYDHRDTGRSVTYEPGAPGYTGPDLVADAIGVLDALDVPSAHVVGMSMGGALAQIAALDYPEWVDSLTLISTSPGGPQEPDLPGMPEEAIAEFRALPEPADWSDRASVIDYGVSLARASASRTVPFDEDGMRELWGRVFDRSANVASTMKNHHLAESGEPWRGRLGNLSLPVLVIHGDEDPVLPYEHGLALVREIDGARIVTLEQTGHEIPRRGWDVVIPAILDHTAAAS